MSKDRYGNFYIEDVVRFQKQIEGVLQGIKETAWNDGLDMMQCIPVDPGQAGKVASKFYVNFLAENGISTRTEGVNPHSNKVTRFNPFASVATNGSVKIVKGDWNRAWLDEVCFFTGERKNVDDQVDATSSAFNMLARSAVIPTFALPTFSQPSPIPSL